MSFSPGAAPEGSPWISQNLRHSHTFLFMDVSSGTPLHSQDPRDYYGLKSKSFYGHLTLFICCKPDSSLLIQGQPFFDLLGNMCIDFYLMLLLLRVKLVDTYQTHIRT